MKVSGETIVPGAPEEVFGRLLDREVLQRCIPGCESLEDQGDGVHAARVKVGVGAIKGTFKATVTLSDLQPPASYRMGLEARSPVGHARGGALVALDATPEGTRLSWEGEVRISGVIAAVGQRLLGAAARRFTDDFFAALREACA